MKVQDFAFYFGTYQANVSQKERAFTKVIYLHKFGQPSLYNRLFIRYKIFNYPCPKCISDNPPTTYRV